MDNSPVYNKQNEIVSYITGYENINFGGMAQERKMVALAVFSTLVAVQNGLSLSFYIGLHTENSMLSVVVFFFGVLVFLMINRMYFISSSKTGNGFKAIFAYMGIYALVSFLITSSVLCYYFMEPEILEIISYKTALNRYGGMIQLLEHLSPEQQRSYNEFKYTTFFISVIIASLPVATQKLLINHKELFAIESRNNELRTSLYKKLQQKKTEFANLYEQPAEGPLFGENAASGDDIRNKKDLIMTEIAHLEEAIHQIL
ncbi:MULTISPECIES: hypothetical protein [unclassified Chryseobacterium]|uniref:hypothetical protein n=1 Tax=unclassified Chryseobacterium TaxID=2593645 RepID=UPI000D394ED8|nr:MULTISPECIES: hypothetical protein [unclassified Chryseobacterium]PTT75248.1 hypothetical protein DBR25_08820 [Chryseobacterium sp. HMWF001]PVV50772.1 hypothetical protein DD829_21450 [Chryseobacterium sp. HMWF035]